MITRTLREIAAMAGGTLVVPPEFEEDVAEHVLSVDVPGPTVVGEPQEHRAHDRGAGRVRLGWVDAGVSAATLLSIGGILACRFLL